MDAALPGCGGRNGAGVDLGLGGQGVPGAQPAGRSRGARGGRSGCGVRGSEAPGGAAFSIGGTSTTILFTAIAVGVVIFIVRTSRRIFSLPWAIALGLLLGGAMGNLTDRIFRSPAPFRGWVVDWIQVPHWPVFNLADSAICCGGALMVLLTILGVHPDGQVDRRSRRSGTKAEATR